MIYRVTARFKPETADELRRQLDDGSIAAQRPDGQEIVASLNRAVMTGTDSVQWNAMCFCDPPLAHERATVLDRYFDDIGTVAIEDYERYAGELFLDRLQKL
jgi:hypothetical protein